MIWSTPMYKKPTRVEGKIVVITGANTGIGKETARDLYKRGASIIMGVRDLTKGRIARDEIFNGAGQGYVDVFHLDLQSLKSVRKFAKKVEERANRVDILVNNAGVMACPRTETSDGFESQLGVNHLAHFLLTMLLLPRLKAASAASPVGASGARIINLTSAAHTFGRMDFDDLMLSRGQYSPWGAYGQSKLANILFTRELARRLSRDRITVYAVHPGMVNTELWRHLPWSQYIVFKAKLILWYKSSVQGAQTTLYCALDPELAKISGRYYADCAELAPSEAAQNDNDAKRLWKQSCQLVGIADK